MNGLYLKISQYMKLSFLILRRIQPSHEDGAGFVCFDCRDEKVDVPGLYCRLQHGLGYIF